MRKIQSSLILSAVLGVVGLPTSNHFCLICCPSFVHYYLQCTALCKIDVFSLVSQAALAQCTLRTYDMSRCYIQLLHFVRSPQCNATARNDVTYDDMHILFCFRIGHAFRWILFDLTFITDCIVVVVAWKNKKSRGYLSSRGKQHAIACTVPAN